VPVAVDEGKKLLLGAIHAVIQRWKKTVNEIRDYIGK
jgi:hypothetical protein